MVSNMSEKTICSLCGGAGGWKDYSLDSKWRDCVLCDGYGFYEKTELEKVATLLDFTKQTSGFRNEMEKFGRIISFETYNNGKEIHVAIVPKSRDIWVKFVKKILFVCSGNESCTFVPKQVFFQHTDNKVHYYWEVKVGVSDLIDLDIFTDYIASLDWEEEKNV